MSTLCDICVIWSIILTYKHKSRGHNRHTNCKRFPPVYSIGWSRKWDPTSSKIRALLKIGRYKKPAPPSSSLALLPRLLNASRNSRRSLRLKFSLTRLLGFYHISKFPNSLSFSLYDSRKINPETERFAGKVRERERGWWRFEGNDRNFLSRSLRKREKVKENIEVNDVCLVHFSEAVKPELSSFFLIFPWKLPRNKKGKEKTGVKENI